MKRFTETEKWMDAWFCELSQSFKLLYLYLLDACDPAGVFEYSQRWAELAVGEPVDFEGFLEVSEGRIKQIERGKYWIIKFCDFQYKEVSRKAKAHSKIVASIDKYSLPVSIKEDSGRIQFSKKKTLSNTHSKGIQYPLDGSQEEEEEEEKEKELEADKDGETAELFKIASVIGCWFNRSSLTPDELKTLDSLNLDSSSPQFDAVRRFYLHKPREGETLFRRQSIAALLEHWQGEVDKANRWAESTPYLNSPEEVIRLITGNPKQKTGRDNFADSLNRQVSKKQITLPEAQKQWAQRQREATHS